MCKPTQLVHMWNASPILALDKHRALDTEFACWERKLIWKRIQNANQCVLANLTTVQALHGNKAIAISFEQPHAQEATRMGW